MPINALEPTFGSLVIAWDANYIYICTATNIWKRVAIDTWVTP